MIHDREHSLSEIYLQPISKNKRGVGCKQLTLEAEAVQTIYAIMRTSLRWKHGPFTIDHVVPCGTGTDVFDGYTYELLDEFDILPGILG